MTTVITGRCIETIAVGQRYVLLPSHEMKSASQRISTQTVHVVQVVRLAFQQDMNISDWLGVVTDVDGTLFSGIS